MKGQHAQKTVSEAENTQRERILDRAIPGPRRNEAKGVIGTGEDDEEE
jgi:hypothetical protein